MAMIVTNDMSIKKGTADLAIVLARMTGPRIDLLTLRTRTTRVSRITRSTANGPRSAPPWPLTTASIMCSR